MMYAAAQAAFRARSGKVEHWGGDLHAALDAAGVPPGQVGERIAAYTGLSATAGLQKIMTAGFTAAAGVQGPWLAFSLADTLPQAGLTFTRASSATYINAAGSVATAANDVARITYDPVTHERLGVLIEGQATNIFPNSEALEAWAGFASGHTVTANNAVAPDGTLTADTLVLAPEGYRYQNCSTTLIVAWAGGIWLRSDTPCNLPIRLTRSNGSESAVLVASVTPAWTRFETTFTPLSNPVTVQLGLENRTAFGADATTKTVQVWGGQVEVGARLTSYISTAAASVVRAQDNLLLVGAPFVALFNQVEGSFLVEASAAAYGTQLALNADSSNNNNVVSVVHRRSFAGSGGLQIFSGGALQTDLYNVSLPTPAGFTKTAVSYKLNAMRSATSSWTGGEDTTAAMPVGIDRIVFGNRSAGGTHLNGVIRSVDYWPVAKTLSELQVLVTS